jgi:hypothetical protein
VAPPDRDAMSGRADSGDRPGPRLSWPGRKARRPRPPHDASARISAYIYGNIIAFAALVPLDADAAEHLHGLSLTAGAAATTFLAHLLAELVGSSAVENGGPASSALRHEIGSSMPILTTAAVPCLLLGASAAGLLPGGVALLIAQGYLLIRIALVGLIIEQIRSTRISPRGLLAGVAVAALAGLVVVAKTVLSH